jgi:serine/threonine protein kinase
MAPELLLGEEYNKQIDWWAVGIIIYEMIYGKNPFNLQNKTLNFK